MPDIRLTGVIDSKYINHTYHLYLDLTLNSQDIANNTSKYYT